MTLYRGVYPISFHHETLDHAVLNRAVVEEFLQRNLASKDDLVILSKGDLTGVKGGTNALKISRITDVLAAAPASETEKP
jgi:pyruvate kinase